MSTDTTDRLQPHAVALLRGGPRAAVTVAVVALYLADAVEASGQHTMRTSGVPAGAAALPPLTKAVHSALYRRAEMGQLTGRLAVRTALARLREELTAAGLLRAFPPGRTRAARAALRALRRGHPLPAGRESPPDEETLLLVALYGDRALAAFVPGFARRAGLVRRPGAAERGLPQSWGSGAGGGGVGCDV
ncbi:TIGR04222 domain-containing membrane protein [Streptomyces sp. NPDC005423]|uniref:TIGR04222 domain-containing membrane protein n=1 Tax=Streptomyces sp. NPDC005423 TaxID=3155343 RepID=UPI0033BC86B6